MVTKTERLVIKRAFHCFLPAIFNAGLMFNATIAIPMRICHRFMSINA